MNTEAAEQQLLITKEQIISPVVEILKQVTPTEPTKAREVPQSITQSLNELFPEQQYDEKHMKKAKEILGPLSQELSSEELSESLAEMQFLVKSWVDEFERTIFDGKTLNELLNEKGGK